MMRFVLFLLLMSMIFLEGKEVTSLQANEIKPPNNECANALNQLSEFRAEAVYGSPLEDAWHPAAFYKLIHRMRQLQVIQQEFRDRAEDWIFEFVELKEAGPWLLSETRSIGNQHAGVRMPFLC